MTNLLGFVGQIINRIGLQMSITKLSSDLVLRIPLLLVKNELDICVVVNDDDDISRKSNNKLISMKDDSDQTPEEVIHIFVIRR